MATATNKNNEEEEALSLTEAQNELSTLGRVSHRLAMTDAGAPLERVLKLLLPKLLVRIGKNHQRTQTLQLKTTLTNHHYSKLKASYDQIHAKLVEMLGHAMNRVRADQKCTLPCLAIMELLDFDNNQNESHSNMIKEEDSVDAFTLNLGLAFLSLGLRRCPMDEVLNMLPHLLSLLGAHSVLCKTAIATQEQVISRQSQFHQVSHLTLRAIQRLVAEKQPVPASNSSSPSKATTTSAAPTSTTPSKTTSTAEEDSKLPMIGEEVMSSLDRARVLCSLASSVDSSSSSTYNPKNVGAALYELLLDVLLYQPTTKTTVTSREELQRLANGPPPAGLGSEGHKRLITGAASPSYNGSGVKNWYNEFLSPVKLRDFKVAVLVFVAPSGKWAIFQPPSSTNMQQQQKHQQQQQPPFESNMGIARNVALLVVSSGDSHMDVAQKGTSYLKMYLDTVKRAATTATTETQYADMSATATSSLASLTSTTASVVGAPVSLACELLGLVLGGYGSASILTQSRRIMTLQESANAISVSAIAPAYRSLVNEKTAVSIMNFVQSKLLEDEPHLLRQHDATGGATTGTSSCVEEEQEGPSTAMTVGHLAISVADHILKGTNSISSSSGANIGSNKGCPKVAAAKLINSLCIRMVSHYESSQQSQLQLPVVQSSGTGITPMSIMSQSNNDNSNSNINNEANEVRYILSRVFATACHVLSTAATPHDSGSSYHTEARNSCYGIVCVLARSKALHVHVLTSQQQPPQQQHADFLFDGSISPLHPKVNPPTSDSNNVSVPIVTASLLFGCAANEEEALRIRATAALDALLSTYCRLILLQKEAAQEEKDDAIMSQGQEVTTNPAVSVNPWGPSSDPEQVTTTTGENSATVSAHQEQQQQLCKSLLPVLWRAAHPSQPKASRLAAASWADKLIQPLNLTSATHLLCYLAGDADATTSALARTVLRVSELDEDVMPSSSRSSSKVEANSTTTKNDEPKVELEDEEPLSSFPEFNEIVALLFQGGGGGANKNTSRSMSARPTFYEFPSKAKGTTLRLGLACLLSDFYGGDDDAVLSFMRAITDTIQHFAINRLGLQINATSATDMSDLFSSNVRSSSSHPKSSSGLDTLELLEDCSVALAGCLACSSYARQVMAAAAKANPSSNNNEEAALTVSHHSIALLSIVAPSSKARRLFAKACGVLYDDLSLWTSTTADIDIAVEESVKEWVEQSGIAHALKICARKLSTVAVGVGSNSSSNNDSKIDEVHGAAHLGSYCVRSVRLNLFQRLSDGDGEASEQRGADPDSKDSSSSAAYYLDEVLQLCGNKSSDIIEYLGKGCLDKEEVVGNACAESLSVALSFQQHGEDAPSLPIQLQKSCTWALDNLGKAANAFGNGDRADAIRVISVVRAIGAGLAATTSTTTNIKAVSSSPLNGASLSEGDAAVETPSLAAVRLECIDYLFKLLGSSSNRAESEVALVVGESLSMLADAYSPPGVQWTKPTSPKPEAYSETYAASLPPHEM
jgi:proteasome component ECM29